MTTFTRKQADYKFVVQINQDETIQTQNDIVWDYLAYSLTEDRLHEAVVNSRGWGHMYGTLRRIVTTSLIYLHECWITHRIPEMLAEYESFRSRNIEFASQVEAEVQVPKQEEVTPVRWDDKELDFSELVRFVRECQQPVREVRKKIPISVILQGLSEEPRTFETVQSPIVTTMCDVYFDLAPEEDQRGLSDMEGPSASFLPVSPLVCDGTVQSGSEHSANETVYDQGAGYCVEGRDVPQIVMAGALDCSSKDLVDSSDLVVDIMTNGSPPELVWDGHPLSVSTPAIMNQVRPRSSSFALYPPFPDGGDMSTSVDHRVVEMVSWKDVEMDDVKLFSEYGDLSSFPFSPRAICPSYTYLCRHWSHYRVLQSTLVATVFNKDKKENMRISVKMDNPETSEFDLGPQETSIARISKIWSLPTYRPGKKMRSNSGLRKKRKCEVMFYGYPSISFRSNITVISVLELVRNVPHQKGS